MNHSDRQGISGTVRPIPRVMSSALRLTPLQPGDIKSSSVVGQPQQGALVSRPYNYLHCTAPCEGTGWHSAAGPHEAGAFQGPPGPGVCLPPLTLAYHQRPVCKHVCRCKGVVLPLCQGPHVPHAQVPRQLWGQGPAGPPPGFLSLPRARGRRDARDPAQPRLQHPTSSLQWAGLPARHRQASLR